MRATWITLGIFASLLVYSVAASAAEPESVPLDQLPKPVTAALKAKFPDAKLKSATKQEQDGKPQFTVAFTLKDLEHEARLTAEGKLTESRKSMLPRELPNKVAFAIVQKYPRGTNQKAAEITRGETVTYEVFIKTGDKRLLDVELDDTGKVLKETERKEEKKP